MNKKCRKTTGTPSEKKTTGAKILPFKKRVPTENVKPELEAYRNKINDLIKKDPKNAKKAALIVEKMLKSS